MSLKRRKSLAGLIGGGIATLCGIFLFIKWPDYWQETVVNNWAYALPHLKEASGVIDYLRMFLYGFWSVTFDNNLLTIWFKLVALLWLLSLALLIATRRWRLCILWFNCIVHE